jgi:hypothetical protein
LPEELLIFLVEVAEVEAEAELLNPTVHLAVGQAALEQQDRLFFTYCSNAKLSPQITRRRKDGSKIELTPK